MKIIFEELTQEFYVKLYQYLEKRKDEKGSNETRIISLRSVGSVSVKDGEANYKNVEVIVNLESPMELRGSLKGLAEVFKQD